MKKHDRLNSMLRVDFRRMFTSSMLHIFCGAALVMPILILVMTSMVAGSTVTDPQTGAETTWRRSPAPGRSSAPAAA